ncbi:MAG: LemA family protein [Tissierellia bacterium]|nr:LemA family protein [Tissierellia bacterium]MDD4047049.1 LemA family protein [Tissierellia bacterium]
MGIFIAIIIIVILLAAWAVVSYNGFVKLRNQIEEAFSTMDIYLKKRYEMIPNLVEIVKQYSIHEKETLEKIVQARSMAINARSVEERGQNENMLSGALKSLFAISEGYPELKANQNYLELQDQLVVLEDDISQSRKYYNGVVKVMNNKVEIFPSNLFAKIFGFNRYPYFMADEYERQNVEIRFN